MHCLVLRYVPFGLLSLGSGNFSCYIGQPNSLQTICIVSYIFRNNAFLFITFTNGKRGCIGSWDQEGPVAQGVQSLEGSEDLIN